ncbi:MAG: acylphosphatase [Butyrivibrio sp.]|nr:acylphosphatase [Butyrivibrio sp.]MBP3197662.1 acylphosphatase [Butyrivibrio sp.]
MMKRYKLQFYGSVQGVGFRYTARHAANMYRLTGYVRNEYDGSVTCEVQGEQDAIDEFIRTLSRGRFIDISYIDKTVMDIIEDERSFDVRY